MKTLYILFLIFTIIGSQFLMAQVSITIDGSSADGSAMMEVKSTDKGFLPPRMTGSERDAISSPATGLIVFCTDCGDNGELQVYNGTEWTNMIGGEASVYTPNVTNPTTGEIWMDRNLGASQVAASSTDSDAYGDLYQWGRAAEGHQIRTSGTTSTNATTAVPNDGNAWDGLFITEDSSPYDWLTPQDNTLWQGVSGTNNPCPSGYRLPTVTEWDAERQSWSSDNEAGAFASPLKLPVAGQRHYSVGTIHHVGSFGYYWSSTVNGTDAQNLVFYSNGAAVGGNYRARGFSVRCIKD